jgi:hypothetical protein
MRKQPNYTCMLKKWLKLYCIWTWDTLWIFFLVLCSFVLFYVTPLMRQLQNNISGTISRIGGWGMNTKIIKTETSLHLNLEGFFFIFYFILYIYFFLSFTYFLFSFLSLFFLFFIFNPLCLSNAFSAYSRLVHWLSLFISLKLLLFFSTWLFVFPFSFNFFAFHPL